ncbi:hypothetical protein [Cupriavidus nantongensis]|uniref:Ribbon-helix-helix protein CopG domain-containing protein n=1 Tax=Cupriavidus nantongensis TaxID=1796606 RepID=A0A142JNG8_9BURK|nr:hypothetical protein [Cupriavidus nantongensis]AMR79630.1 hypothetical protein A2G96_18800 [Cupriavidus nantongensis]
MEVRYRMFERDADAVTVAAERLGVSASALIRAFARHLGNGGSLNFDPKLGAVHIGRPRKNRESRQ